MNKSFEKMLSLYRPYDLRTIKPTKTSFEYRLENAIVKQSVCKFYNIPFEVKIMYNNDTLGLQMFTDEVLSETVLKIIACYFDKYDTKKDIIWTKDKDRIIEFFKEGIYYINLLSGRTRIGINQEKRKGIIKMILESDGITEYNEALFLENFKYLQIMNWDDLIIKVHQDEHVNEVTCMDIDLDFENPYSGNEEIASVSVSDISDGLVYSLNQKGCVDIEYISAISKASLKEVIIALKGSIYQNPLTWNECFYKGWETADEYLSGNIREKLIEAKKADKAYRGWFSDNVKALEGLIPKRVQAEEIYVNLGSPWLPEHIVEEFIIHLLGDLNIDFTSSHDYNTFAIRHDSITGAWEIPRKRRYDYVSNVKSTVVYGTKRYNALEIIEKSLNMKSVTVYDAKTSYTTKSGVEFVINKEETLQAIDRQNKIKAAFTSWIWNNPDRKKELETIFRNKFCCVRKRCFDGSFLQLPDMSRDITLYPYQKDAVARILFTPNTLLAHDVGSGKTYIMIAAGMEKRRLSLSKKNMYVVPNNLVGQWKEIFLSMYPNANILSVEPKVFKPEKREQILKKIRDNDYDAIIIAYSCFSMIPLSKDYYLKSLTEEIDTIKRRLDNDKNAAHRLKSRLKELEKKRSKIAVEPEYETTYFDELGITSLFVDEAHNFKNISIHTEIHGVLGINSKGSKKCDDMLNKVYYIQKQNNGGGVVFATGTPITNSITDAYVMQRYLQNGELRLTDFYNFDSWVGMFAEPVTQFEVDVDTNNYRMATRFSVFHNLPELTAMISNFADFHKVDNSDEVPEFEEHNVMVTKTPDFAEYLEDISARADMVRSKQISKKEDNMLKITTDGRKAALDIRLVLPNSIYANYDSKAKRCAEKVYAVYKRTSDEKLTQLIFCDSSTPKEGFNLYDDMKDRLVKKGIPEHEIEFIHNADSELKRERLFEKVRTGVVRVLIGSTFKLGLGVNVQDKLVALHHLDVPWRPADMTQREGRILRPGNTNKHVDIFRYITEGSFDAYSWQLLDSKEKFISALLSGNMNERDGSDIDDTVLTYAQVKALAIGNPIIKKRVELSNELSQTLTLQRKFFDTKEKLSVELAELPTRIANQEKKESDCCGDYEFYAKNKREYSKEERTEIRVAVDKALKVHIFETKEYSVCTYQGFEIIIPANMVKEKLCLYLNHNERYMIDMGDSAKGNLIKIDNFLDGLKKYCDNQHHITETLKQRKIETEKEVLKENPYADKIATLKSEIEKIDKELEEKSDE